MTFIIALLLSFLVGIALMRNSFRLWRTIVRFSEKVPVTVATVRGDWAGVEEIVEAELRNKNSTDTVLVQEPSQEQKPR